MLCPAESLRGQVQASWEVKGPPANSGAGHNHRSKCLHSVCVCVVGGVILSCLLTHYSFIHSFNKLLSIYYETDPVLDAEATGMKMQPNAWEKCTLKNEL